MASSGDTIVISSESEDSSGSASDTEIDLKQAGKVKEKKMLYR